VTFVEGRLPNRNIFFKKFSTSFNTMPININDCELDVRKTFAVTCCCMERSAAESRLGQG